jgi:hypothetical protein
MTALSLTLVYPLHSAGPASSTVLCGTQIKESTMYELNKSSDPTLHVFEQDGLWQWGITCKRPGGVGNRIMAYSDPGFHSQHEARADGERARFQRGVRDQGECD